MLNKQKIKIVLMVLCPLLITAFSPLKGVKKYKLSNGLRCILKEDHAQKLVAVQVWVRAGSVNENDRTNGISHFFEHMIFKGTARYPGNEISRTVEANGGSINAATSSEYTRYHIDIPSDGLEEALSILSDAMIHCTFPTEELEKERHVILEEIKRKDDQPNAPVWDNLRDELYQTTPYGYKVIGTSTVVQSLTRNDMLEFYNTYYRPDNMILVVVGDFNIKKTKKMIGKYFAAQKQKSKIIRPDLVEKKKNKYNIIISSRPIKQTYIEAGFLGPVFNNDDQYALDIGSIILGQGRSSRLYRTLREEMKIVWSVGASFFTRTGSGIFTVSATCDPAHTEQVIAAMTREIDLFQTKPPTKEELQRAKQILKNNWIFDNETYHAQASNLGYFAVLDQLPFMKKYIKRIRKVTAENVQDVFKTYLQKKDMAVSLAVPQ